MTVKNAEAKRILAVLDETVQELSSLSYINSGLVEHTEDLGEILGSKFVGYLESCKNLDNEPEFDKDKTDQVPTGNIFRHLSKDPSVLHHVQSFGFDRSGNILSLVDAIKRLRQGTHRRLSVTVEEENSRRSHFEEVCKREEKASKEKLSLEQQLRIERRERQKALTQLGEAEVRTKNELEVVKAGTEKFMKDLVVRTEDTKNRNAKQYDFDFDILLEEITKLEKELKKLEVVHREDEAKLIKKKNKSEQEVETWIKEYDIDMNKVEKIYQDENEVYSEVVEQLRVYEGHYNQLRKEIEDANAREEEQKKAKEEAEEQKKREEKAAATIQATWKMFQQQKEAEGKKSKGKGKGK